MQTFTPDAIVVNGKMLRGMSLTVDGDRIAALEAKIGGEPVAGVIVPGFVDTHVHGGGGADFASDPQTAIKVHRWAGSTSIIASLVSAPIEDLIAQVRQLRPLIDAGELAGIHLEGPFLSPERAGAHRVDALSLPTPTAVNALLQAGGEALSMVTLAPELPGAMEAIDAFVAAGVRVALGHTNATRDHASAAFAHGATIVTHAFNAMAGIHHREPGLLPLALTDPRILIEVIPDGYHVHRDVVDLLRACAPGRVALVTDAMAGACMQDGTFDLGGQSVDVVDGVARTSDGALAGSTLTMARAFETVRGWRWCWSEAVSATSSAPSRWHRGIARGGLTVGSRADFCVVDTHGRLNNVMYGGNWTLG